jgi:hypothetical protein
VKRPFSLAGSQRLPLQIFAIAFGALVVGVIIGRYVFPVLKIYSSGQTAASLPASIPLSPGSSVSAPAPHISSTLDSEGSPSMTSADDLIAQIKTALTYSGRQHSYVALSKLADSVNTKNVREVLTFAQTLREQDKSMLIPLLIGRWAELDPKAAVAYAQDFPEGSSDPQAAMQWAATISNENLRSTEVEALAGAWLKTDPNSAATWIAGSSLPDEMKARLLPKPK